MPTLEYRLKIPYPSIRIRARYVLIAAIIFYTAFLFRHTCFAVAGSDSSGYFNAAHLIREGRLKIRVTPLDVMHLDDSWRGVFLPLGFATIGEPRMFAPSYPLGYPLHVAFFSIVGGWKHVPFYVTPIASLLTLYVLYRLAREFGVPRGLSIAASLCLAISPSWLFQAFQPMSDVPAALWCAIAMLCAMHADRSPRWALACGAAFAIAVWVRPSDLVLALPIGFAMRWNVRRLATAVGASLPFAIALMVVNKYLYGKALTTGYGDIGSIMTWGDCGPHHARWLAITLTPIIFPGGLFVALNRRVPLWQRLTLLSWFAVFFAFYSSYAICDAWWYLRFLLPAYPPLLIATALMLRDFVPRRAMQVALIAIVVLTGIAIMRYYDIQHLYEGEKTDMHAIHWARKQMPKNTLMVMMQMSGSYYYYTKQLAARYDYLDPARFEELRAYAGAADLKWYALVYEWELRELKTRMPGKWTRVNHMRNVFLLRLDS